MIFKKYQIAVLAVSMVTAGPAKPANAQGIDGGSHNGAAPAGETSDRLGSGTILQAELSKGLDAKKAKAGDPVEAKLT